MLRRWWARPIPAWASTQAPASSGPRCCRAAPISRAWAASASPWSRGWASNSPASPHISAVQFPGCGDDVVLARDDEEGGTGQWSVRVRTDHAAHRQRAVAGLDDRAEHALAHAGAAPALVHHQHAPGRGDLAADEVLVERHQPAQVDHPHL